MIEGNVAAGDDVAGAVIDQVNAGLRIQLRVRNRSSERLPLAARLRVRCPASADIRRVYADSGT